MAISIASINQEFVDNVEISKQLREISIQSVESGHPLTDDEFIALKEKLSNEFRQKRLENERPKTIAATTSTVDINKDSKPVEKIIEPVISTPQIIEKTENHYHLESLNTGLKTLGYSLLGIFGVFFFIKTTKSLKKTMILHLAMKRSQKLLLAFDKAFKEKVNYLDFSTKISNQLVINNLLISHHSNKDDILKLIINTDQLKERLNFLETNLIKQYQH